MQIIVSLCGTILGAIIGAFVKRYIEKKETQKTQKGITFLIIASVCGLIIGVFLSTKVPTGKKIDVMVTENRGEMYVGETINIDKIAESGFSADLKDDFGKYIDDGNKYFKEEKFDKALLCLNKALELKPNYFEGYFNRGGVYLAMGLYDEAIKDLSRFIEAKPLLAGRGYYARFLAYSKKGMTKEAQIDYEKYLSATKDDNGLLQGVSTIKEERKELVGADSKNPNDVLNSVFNNLCNGSFNSDKMILEGDYLYLQNAKFKAFKYQLRSYNGEYDDKRGILKYSCIIPAPAEVFVQIYSSEEIKDKITYVPEGIIYNGEFPIKFIDGYPKIIVNEKNNPIVHFISLSKQIEDKSIIEYWRNLLKNVANENEIESMARLMPVVMCYDEILGSNLDAKKVIADFIMMVNM